MDYSYDNDLTQRVDRYRSSRTTFFEREAESGERETWIGTRKKWDQLWRHQHGWNDDRIGRRAYYDKMNRAEALSDTFGLSKRQKERVVEIVTDVNGRRFNQIGGVDALAFGTIAAVVDEDVDDLDERIVGTEHYEMLCMHHDVDGWAACRKAKEIIRERKTE